MNILDQLTARASADQKHIVLAEGHDQRIVRAAQRAAAEGLAQITVLGNRETIQQLTGDDSLGNGIEVIDPDDFSDIATYAEIYRSLLKRNNITDKTAIRAARKPLNFAHLMVRAGDADGALAGAAHSSAQVIRSAKQIIGQHADCKMVSSFFLMVLDRHENNQKRVMAFADCAIVENPDADELAHIASATADSFQKLLPIDPKVALLSFATGQHSSPAVRKVMDAGLKLQQMRPALPVAAPIQFDAAFLPKVAAQKAPESNVADQANIFIFPDLNAGNIGYKICERVGRANALGPILQGFVKPVNDLSRGCSEQDIHAMIAITAIQTQTIK
ncbi:MAG: phosphate acetyltransferase [Parasphingorhabdus sp.]